MLFASGDERATDLRGAQAQTVPGVHDVRVDCTERHQDCEGMDPETASLAGYIFV